MIGDERGEHSFQVKRLERLQSKVAAVKDLGMG